MVRIKHRYLLVQILSPTLLHGEDASPASHHSKSLVTINKRQHQASDNILALHAPTPDTVDVQKLVRLIRSSIAQQFGDYGASIAGGAGLKIVYWSNATSTFVLRCRRETFRMVWASLCFIRTLPRLAAPTQVGASVRPDKNKIQEKEVTFRVVRNSGTIKKSLEEVVRRNKAIMGRLKGMQATSDGLELGVGGTNDAEQNMKAALGLGRGSASGLDDAFDANDPAPSQSDPMNVDDENDGSEISDSDESG